MFDVEYQAQGGEGVRSKITFISWVPDDSPQYVSDDGSKAREAHTDGVGSHA